CKRGYETLVRVARSARTNRTSFCRRSTRTADRARLRAARVLVRSAAPVTAQVRRQRPADSCQGTRYSCAVASRGGGVGQQDSRAPTMPYRCDTDTPSSVVSSTRSGTREHRRYSCLVSTLEHEPLIRRVLGSNFLQLGWARLIVDEVLPQGPVVKITVTESSGAGETPVDV